jgi:hypothetical protein
MTYPRAKFNFLKSILLISALFVSFLVAKSQTTDYLLNKSYDNLPWKVFVEKAENEFPVRFFYDDRVFPDFKVTVSANEMPLKQCLTENLQKYPFKISIDQNGNIFLTKQTEVRTALPPDFFNLPKIVETSPDTTQTSLSGDKKFLRTANEFVVKTFVVGTKKEGVNLKKATISGVIKNAEDGSPVIGATIFVKELETGTATDNAGIYTLTLPKGKFSLVVRSVDTEEAKYKVEVLSDGKLDLLLEKKVFMMEEVEIRSETRHNVKGIQMGFEKIAIKNIKEIPVVLGERDIVKVALLLPGVQSVGEGSSGFNVRGSPADQNLFYINNVPVYNTSHLFGFFSAFNPDVVNDFTLYKSNIPAKYGGRLSSIFELSARQGNPSKFSARGGISPITTRLLAEGPIVKDKLNFLVGLRSTYSDWVLNFVNVPEVKNSSATFGDLVTNLSYHVNSKNQLRLFTYYSFDKINLASEVKNNYGNAGASLSWFHTFNSRHDFDFALIYDKYNFTEENQDYALSAYKLAYELQHYEANLNFSYRLNDKHTINYGLNSILYNLNSGDYLPLNSGSLVEPIDLGSEKGLESGLFIDDEWKALPNLTLYGGLRLNNYACLGPNEVYKYLPGQPKIAENVLDTFYFDNNAIIKNYSGLDYRFAATFLLNPDLSVKASFNTLHQYIFMLSNTVALSPTDKWKLCDYNIEPMEGNQFSLGVYSNLVAGLIETSVEGYYKKVNKLVEYKDGADLVVNEFPERDILQGQLDAFGIELMLKKPFGKWNGWINYTYASANVLVDNKITGEQNNFGKRYPANYDKPHSLNVVANYKVMKRLSFSGNLVYSTGRPITYPTSIYYQDGQKILSYSLRNEYRIPDYFRVDVSLTFEGNLRKKKKVHGSWVFSVYNLTGRNNAYSVYFKSESGMINGYKMSIFGSPIFSVTYDFKLGNYAD